MAATFAFRIISALFTKPDGISILKKLFLSSLLTPNSRNITNIYRAMLNGAKL